MLPHVYMNKNRKYSRILVRCGYMPVPNSITPKKFHTICSNLTDDCELGNFIADFDNWYLTGGTRIMYDYLNLVIL